MRADKKLWQNRKAKKELARRLRSENPGLEVVHPHAAGIDVGNGAHYVAVRPDRDLQPVRRFECFTADLYRLAEWLHSCGGSLSKMLPTLHAVEEFKDHLEVTLEGLREPLEFISIGDLLKPEPH